MSVLRLLIETARNLAINAPTFCRDSEGRESNHWTGTKDQMELVLGRRLTAFEVECLCLSRAFGPSPVLTNEEAKELVKYLWPEGNGQGLRLEWYQLASKLEAYWELNGALRQPKK